MEVSKFSNSNGYIIKEQYVLDLTRCKSAREEGRCCEAARWAPLAAASPSGRSSSL